MKNELIALAWIFAVAIGIATISLAQPAKLQEVKIASGGHIVHFLPLDLAVAKGFFQDEGLDPTITILNGGTATAQALMADQVDFSANGIDHAIKAAVQGRGDLRLVVLLNQTPGVVVVAGTKYQGQIKTIADLKGKRLGVTSFGSASHMVMAFLLHKSGVDLKDVSIVNAGTATFAPALKSGSIDAGIAIEPFASAMVEQGEAFVLQRLMTPEDSLAIFGGPYNLTGILTRQKIINDDPMLVQKVVNVMIRSLAWIKEHTAEEIVAALPSEVVGSSKDSYISTLKEMNEFLSPDGAISKEGAANVLESMLLSGVLENATGLSAETYIDRRFVNQAAGRATGQADELRSLVTHPNKPNRGWSQVLAGLILAAMFGGGFWLYRQRKNK